MNSHPHPHLHSRPQPVPAPLVPIPAGLEHLPVVAGIAVPWITPRTSDGRFLFGLKNAERHRRCLVHHRCQICGRRLAHPLVLLASHSDLPRRRTREAGVHPSCAEYSLRACPAVGDLTRPPSALRSPFNVNTASGGHTGLPGALSEPWYALWLRDYNVVIDPATGAWTASWAHTVSLRIRPLGRLADLLNTSPPAAPPTRTHPDGTTAETLR